MELLKPLKTPKNKIVFNCNNCDFTTCNKKDYTKHLLTPKHQKRVLGDESELKIPTNYTCNYCKKIYKSKNGLWKHNKNCNNNNNLENENIIITPDSSNNNVIQILIKENSDFKTIIMDLIKNNTELQKQMLEVCKNSNNTTTINANTTTNNSNNKTFNLQFFLHLCTFKTPIL